MLLILTPLSRRLYAGSQVTSTASSAPCTPVKLAPGLSTGPATTTSRCTHRPKRSPLRGSTTTTLTCRSVWWERKSLLWTQRASVGSVWTFFGHRMIMEHISRMASVSSWKRRKKKKRRRKRKSARRKIRENEKEGPHGLRRHHPFFREYPRREVHHQTLSGNLCLKLVTKGEGGNHLEERRPGACMRGAPVLTKRQHSRFKKSKIKIKILINQEKMSEVAL